MFTCRCSFRNERNVVFEHKSPDIIAAFMGTDVTLRLFLSFFYIPTRQLNQTLQRRRPLLLLFHSMLSSTVHFLLAYAFPRNFAKQNRSASSRAPSPHNIAIERRDSGSPPYSNLSRFSIGRDDNNNNILPFAQTI